MDSFAWESQIFVWSAFVWATLACDCTRWHGMAHPCSGANTQTNRTKSPSRIMFSGGSLKLASAVGLVCVCLKKAPTTVCGRFTATFPLDNITFALEFMVIVQVPSIFKRSRQLNLNLCACVCVCWHERGTRRSRWQQMGICIIEYMREGAKNEPQPSHVCKWNQAFSHAAHSLPRLLSLRKMAKAELSQFSSSAIRVQRISFYACWSARARLSVCLRYVWAQSTVQILLPFRRLLLSAPYSPLLLQLLMVCVLIFNLTPRIFSVSFSIVCISIYATY